MNNLFYLKIKKHKFLKIKCTPQEAEIIKFIEYIDDRDLKGIKVKIIRSIN